MAKKQKGFGEVFTTGLFKIVLYDIRPKSLTYGSVNIFLLGKDKPGLLYIPPFVIHGVQNTLNSTESFVNMPTSVYDCNDPDKYRLPFDDKRIPYQFDN